MQTERSQGISIFLNQKANEINATLTKSVNVLNKSVSDVNKTVTKAQRRFDMKMIEIRESLAQFRKESDLAHLAIREQTDASLTSIEEATQASLVLVHQESNRTNVRIDELEKKLVPDFTIALFAKECPKNWLPLDGSDIPDDYEKAVLYFESGQMPDMRNRFAMMKGDDTEYLQKLADQTAVNGLHMGWGGSHNQQKYGQTRIHEGSSLAGLARFNSVLDSTYTRGNHQHALYGDPVTRPRTTVLNYCIKIPKE